MRSSSQLSSRLEKPKSISLRINTSASTCSRGNKALCLQPHHQGHQEAASHCRTFSMPHACHTHMLEQNEWTQLCRKKCIWSIQQSPQRSRRNSYQTPCWVIPCSYSKTLNDWLHRPRSALILGHTFPKVPFGNQSIVRIWVREGKSLKPSPCTLPETATLWRFWQILTSSTSRDKIQIFFIAPLSTFQCFYRDQWVSTVRYLSSIYPKFLPIWGSGKPGMGTV